MSHRLNKLNETLQATRVTLGWFGVIAATTVLAAVTTCAQAVEMEPALMTRPMAMDEEQAGWLPQGGWTRVTRKSGHLHLQAVDSPANADPAMAEAETVDTLYVRVPGVTLAPGRRPTVPFSAGQLRPRLDHTYALQLGDVPFTLSVQNGLRNAAGVAYGQAAQYTVGYGGQSYVYVLDGHGWDSVVQAVADVDGDGLPDLLVAVGGSNGSEYLLLSSRAQPGRNPATAVLMSDEPGC